MTLKQYTIHLKETLCNCECACMFMFMFMRLSDHLFELGCAQVLCAFMYVPVSMYLFGCLSGRNFI